jgi:hypothetical protein
MDKAQRHSYMGILKGGVEKEFYPQDKTCFWDGLRDQVPSLNGE